MLDREYEEVAKAIAAPISKLVQGQVLHLKNLPVLASTRHSMLPSASPPSGEGDPGSHSRQVVGYPIESGLAAVITQTCDLQMHTTLGGRQLLHVAPIVLVGADSKYAKAADDGSTARYVPVSWLAVASDQRALIDLDAVALIDRGLILDITLGPQPPRALARRIESAFGRPWSRPALPNDVVRSLKPLRDKIVEARNPNLRRFFDAGVYQVRVQIVESLPEGTGLRVFIYLIPYPEWYPDDGDGAATGVAKQLSADLEKLGTAAVGAFDSFDPATPNSSGRTLRTIWARITQVLEQRCQEAVSSATAAATAKGETFEVIGVSVSVAHISHEIDRDSSILDLTQFSLPSWDGTDPIDEQG